MEQLIHNSDYMKRGGGYRSDDLVEALQSVEYSANQMGSHDFTTSRSLRLAKSLLNRLVSHGKRIA